MLSLPCYTQTSGLCCGIVHDTHVNSHWEIYWFLVSLSGSCHRSRSPVCSCSLSLPFFHVSSFSFVTFKHLFYIAFTYLSFYSKLQFPFLVAIFPSFWSFVSSADLLWLRSCWGRGLWCIALWLFSSALECLCSHVVVIYLHSFSFLFFFAWIATWRDKQSPLRIHLMEEA